MAGATGPRYVLPTVGRRNAAVFPDPVWAQAIKSRPASEIGMACFCTGVGLSYFARRTLFIREGAKSSSANELHPSGTSAPLTSTGMSSYLSKLIPYDGQ